MGSRAETKDYLSIGKVALLMDISTDTINRWYKWWNSDEYEKPEGLILPEYVFKDKRKTKYFKKTDIPMLEEFRNKVNAVNKGCMSEFNATYLWGKRGQKILAKKRGEKVE